MKMCELLVAGIIGLVLGVVLCFVLVSWGLTPTRRG